jgi:hypothetical protein
MNTAALPQAGEVTSIKPATPQPKKESRKAAKTQSFGAQSLRLRAFA